jgi:hypothetical protein
MDGACSSFLRSFCWSYSGKFSLPVIKFIFIYDVFGGGIDMSMCFDDIMYTWTGSGFQ